MSSFWWGKKSPLGAVPVKGASCSVDLVLRGDLVAVWTKEDGIERDMTAKTISHQRLTVLTEKKASEEGGYGTER